jgi:hypothetical protein
MHNNYIFENKCIFWTFFTSSVCIWTSSMEQGPWETDSHMTDKENLHILGNLKVFHVRKILPPVPIPSQMNPVCIMIFLWPILIFTQLLVGLPGSIFPAGFFY